jgi:hypothetical protein
VAFGKVMNEELKSEEKGTVGFSTLQALNVVLKIEEKENRTMTFYPKNLRRPLTLLTMLGN